MPSKTLYELLYSVTSGELTPKKPLENFTLDDFKHLPIKKKNAFKKGLYSSLEHEYKLACQVLEGAKGIGLNLHFTITRNSTNNVVNVPSAVFLRKAAFFANIMVITFPCEPPLANCEKSGNERVPKTKSKRGELLPNPGYFHTKHDIKRDKTIILGQVDTKRTGYGGKLEIIKDKDSFKMSQDDFYALVQLICDSLPFLIDIQRSAFIVPSYIKKGSRFHQKHELTSANFKLPELRCQFYETGIADKSYRSIILTTICHPHFSQLAAKNILDVRIQDWIHYSHFQKELFSKLNCVDGTNREALILQELKGISERFKELKTYYQYMLRYCEKKIYVALIPFVEHPKVGLVILIPDDARYRLMDWIYKEYHDDEHKRNLLDKLSNPARFMDFSQEELYLVWRVSHNELEETPMREKIPHPTVFISYHHDDSKVADKLKNVLEKNGIVVRIDKTAMKAGADIQEFIENSIRETDMTLSIISNRSLLSAWVGLESIDTFYHEKFRDNKKFIACYIDDDFLRIDFRLNATKQIDVKIEEIDKLIQEYMYQKIDTVDLDSQKKRLYDLRHNLGNILMRLRESLCVDIRRDKFDKNVATIVSEIKGKN